MAEPLTLTNLVGLDPAVADICTIEASCVTGFEPMAQEEIKERLGCDGILHRGRIVFDIPVSRVRELLTIRTVNNFWVMIGHTHQFDYPESTEEQLASLAKFATSNLDWNKGLAAWNNVFDFKGVMYPPAPPSPPPAAAGVCEESGEEQRKKCKTETAADGGGDGGGEGSTTDPASSILSFRCTCYRSGTNHKFKSVEAAIAVGGKVQEKFNWAVKMKGYDVEVLMNCDVHQVYVGLALTNKSLFNRTVTHFGPTTLRPTICAALVRLAGVQPGDVVLDPMCGGGSIPLEGAQMDSHAYYLGGEIHDKAVQRTRDNLRDLCGTVGLDQGRKMDGLQWDALAPAFRDNSVDVVISDLPFGKRSGSKADNRVLYPKTLLSMARLVRPTTGRAVLLTQDKTSMFKSMGQVAKYWKLQKSFSCNIGGLAALVFMFNRTAESPQPKS